MRFVDLIKASVLLSAGSATLLAAITLIGVTEDFQEVIVYVSVGWWMASIAIGAWLGRRANVSAAILRLLATARSQKNLPLLNPGITMLNRLWSILVATLLASALTITLSLPQIAAIASGFMVIWALSWRKQASAVEAIEERDGVRFYVDKTSPFKPTKLLRTPGFGGSFLNYHGNGK